MLLAVTQQAYIHPTRADEELRKPDIDVSTSACTHACRIHLSFPLQKAKSSYLFRFKTL
jgi:hypothetical protein